MYVLFLVFQLALCTEARTIYSVKIDSTGNRSLPAGDDYELEGKFWIHSSDRVELFSENENADEIEKGLWKPIPVKANVHSGDSDLFTAPGCVCHGITKVYTCVTHWNYRNDQTWRDVVTTVPIEMCALACNSGLFGKQPPTDSPTVYDEDKPVSCVWNNDHIDRWSVITVTRMIFGIDSKKKNTVFNDHGISVGCDVATGVCTTESLTAWVDQSKIGSDCRDPLSMFDDCNWHSPLRAGLRGRLTCDTTSEEYFLTDNIVPVDLCTMRLSAYMSTSKKWVTLAGITPNASSLYPVQADLTGSALDYKLTESVIGSISSLSEIRDKLRTNEGHCPDFESYEDGNYAVKRGVNLCTGSVLSPVLSVRLTPRIHNQTVEVKFFSEGKWEIGFLCPISGIIHREPCGKGTASLFGVRINGTSTAVIDDGKIRVIGSTKTRLSDIRMIRSSGTTPETGGRDKEYIDDEGVVPTGAKTESVDTWYGSIISWFLGWDWIIFRVMCLLTLTLVLVFAVYKAVMFRRGLMLPIPVL